MKKRGLGQLKLPYRQDEITETVLKKELRRVVDYFNKTRKKAQDLWNVYLGGHSILEARRNFKDGNKGDFGDFKIVEPHLMYITDWKSSFIFSKEKKYIPVSVKKNSAAKKELITLDEYKRDTNQRALDKEIALWTIGTGTCYQYTRLRTDDYEIEHEAPYAISKITPCEGLKVYSSYAGNEELFDLIYTPIDDIENVEDCIDIKTSKFEISVYTKTNHYKFKNNLKLDNLDLKDDPNTDSKKASYASLGFFPLNERPFNDARLGVIEIGLPLQDVLDETSSLCANNIKDFVNQIVFFINTQMTAEQWQAVNESGAGELKQNSPQFPVDVKTILKQLDIEDTNVIYERLYSILYFIFGVPLPTAKFSSGGDTGAAREMSGGWKSAYVINDGDSNYFRQSDMRQLRRILSICRSFGEKSPIKTLYASQFDIKYVFSVSSAGLAESQAAIYWIKAGGDIQKTIEGFDIFTDAESYAEAMKQNLKDAAEGKPVMADIILQNFKLNTSVGSGVATGESSDNT